jgi:polyhydroxybutyrate depolymerase
MKKTLIAFCLLFAGHDAAAQAGTHPLNLMSAERERRCIVHVPARCTPDTTHPLVLFFHGGGGTAQSAMDETGWIQKADREGFVVVFPEGTPRHPDRPARFAGNPQTWNDGSARTGLGAVEQGIDDVAFVSARWRSSLSAIQSIRGGYTPRAFPTAPR